MTNLKESLTSLSNHIERFRESIDNEEKTKTSIVLPFIRALGYDVFNPEEVIPEFTADVGIKRGEKVDYALQHGGKVSVIIEVKTLGDKLGAACANQLVRYFSAARVRIGVLTNGERWEFYTDSDDPNIMDQVPFLRLDLSDLQNAAIADLEKFTKENFELDSIVAYAEKLKLVSALKDAINEALDNPDDDFIKLFAKRVYTGPVSAAKLEMFRDLTSRSIRAIVKERVSERLKQALGSAEVDLTEDENIESETIDGGIETTLDELEGFYIVKGILASKGIPPERITYRDRKKYFGVLIDDNSRKWFMHLVLREKTMSIKLRGIPGDSGEPSMSRRIESLNNLYELSDEILTAFNIADEGLQVEESNTSEETIEQE